MTDNKASKYFANFQHLNGIQLFEGKLARPLWERIYSLKKKKKISTEVKSSDHLVVCSQLHNKLLSVHFLI